MTIELEVSLSASGRRTLKRRDLGMSMYADVLEPEGMLGSLDEREFYRAVASYLGALAANGDKLIYRDARDA